MENFFGLQNSKWNQFCVLVKLISAHYVETFIIFNYIVLNFKIGIKCFQIVKINGFKLFNTKSVLNVKILYRKIKVVIIWHVDVSINFVGYVLEIGKLMVFVLEDKLMIKCKNKEKRCFKIQQNIDRSYKNVEQIQVGFQKW